MCVVRCARCAVRCTYAFSMYIVLSFVLAYGLCVCGRSCACVRSFVHVACFPRMCLFHSEIFILSRACIVDLLFSQATTFRHNMFCWHALWLEGFCEIAATSSAFVYNLFGAAALFFLIPPSAARVATLHGWRVLFVASNSSS